MRTEFAAVQVGRYKFNLPNQWRLSSLHHCPPARGFHTLPEANVALDVQVIEGMAAPEYFEHFLAMHRSAGKPIATPPMLPLKIEPCARLAISLGRASSSVKREIYAYQFQGDLVAAALTWAKAPTDLAQLRRILGILLHVALEDQTPAKGKDIVGS